MCNIYYKVSQAPYPLVTISRYVHAVQIMDGWQTTTDSDMLAGTEEITDEFQRRNTQVENKIIDTVVNEVRVQVATIVVYT